MSNRPLEAALTEAERDALACFCHDRICPIHNECDRICPIHNEGAGGHIEYETGDLFSRVARIKAEAVQAERERIAREIEALRCPGSPPSPLARYAYETAKEHAAEIARSEGR